MDAEAQSTAPIEVADPTVRAMILLADSCQVAESQLFVMGGGITMIGPRPQPLGVAIRIEVPWDRANITHDWRLDLLDEDGRPVTLKEKPLVVTGRFEAGRPAGTRPGTPLSVPLAINFPAIPVVPGRSYTFQLSIDDTTHVDWRQSLHVRAV